MKLVYAGDKFPDQIEQSIFLAGPTDLIVLTKRWRKQALAILTALGYEGYVFIPEPRDGMNFPEYYTQIDWENEGLNRADCILFWVPRVIAGKKKLPGFTTNVEYGEWFKSGKIVLGAPEGADKVKYLQYKATQWYVPQAETLEETVKAAIAMVSPGATRSGGESKVPLHIWRLDSFQSWYKELVKAGNRLDDVTVEWVWRVGPKKKKVFIWILHVDIYITSEKRHKKNEVVIGRPDIATVVMYCKENNFAETKVVLVKEFRSPVANEAGYVYELPGGSSFSKVKDYRDLAVAEVEEETGLVIEKGRLKQIGNPQMASTLVSYRSHLYALELDKEEMSEIEKRRGDVHGVVEDTEHTVIEVMTLGKIVKFGYVDWSMIGMIMSATM